MLWVAAAGPGANLAMALAWAFLIKLALMLPGNDYTLPMARMGEAGVKVNLALMLLNLLPIPPLDGGRIAVSLLPHRLAWNFAKIEPYGLFILLALMMSQTLGVIMAPMFDVSAHLIHSLFQI
jgi:Zn-dependent protease